jgi:alkylation response protein AidB-like acyl-CoA dehydrogenase
MSAESLEAVREICASITKRVDRAYIAKCSKNGEFPETLWRSWIDTGLIGLGLPEEYGGSGGSTEDVILALDLQYQAGLMCTALITNYMSRAPILRHGTESQKRRYLPPTATGEEFFSFGITEPDSGTNTFKIKTNAEPRADGSYVINGQKTYQTGFKDAAHVLLVARTSPHDPHSRTSGISLFIVDTKSAGITATEMDIVGILPEKQYAVFYDNVTVPAGNIVGEAGKGLEALFESLNTERLLCSALNVAQADFVLNRAVEYAKIRAPFDKPIGAYQAIQHPMAHAKILIEAARTMLYATARRHDDGGKISLESNMLKVLSSEAYKEAATIAMTTFGGSSVVESQDILPFFILAQLNTVAPINNNSLMSFIAEKALGLPKSY